MRPAESQRPRIGIALSGGTLKATAHIGVLYALETLGIRPHCLAGTSAGAFVAALYAHGYTPHELISLIRRFRGRSLFDYGFPLVSSAWTSLWYRWRHPASPREYRLPHGVLRGDRLYRYFHKRLSGRAAALPYYVIATDLVSGKPVVFTNDPVGLNAQLGLPIDDAAKCVRGSCSLPGVFTPVHMGEKVLVDGAFRHYVPVEILRQAGCDKIIAVNLYSLARDWKPLTVMHVLTRSYDILLQESIEGDVDGPDVVVLEPDVSHLSWISFAEMESGVHVGKRVVYENKDRIFRILYGPPGQAERRIRVQIHGGRRQIEDRPPRRGGL